MRRTLERPELIDLRSFVLWCMSFDPLTRWQPLRSFRDRETAFTERDTMTRITWTHRTRLKYVVLPAGEAPHA